MKSVIVAATQSPPPLGLGIHSLPPLASPPPSLPSSSHPPPISLSPFLILSGRNAEYRSLYGFDVMVDDHFQPQLIEVNFSPDCTRGILSSPPLLLSFPFFPPLPPPLTFVNNILACNYDPDFYNKIFMTLFTHDWMDNKEVREAMVPIWISILKRNTKEMKTNIDKTKILKYKQRTKVILFRY